MPIKGTKGYVLIVALFFTAIFLVITVGVISIVNSEINMSRYQSDSIKAFFLAEAGLQRAIAAIRDEGDISTVPDTFKLSYTGVSDESNLDNTIINIQAQEITGNIYRLTSSATLGNATRTLRADVMYNPPSKVFDYAYFINNWGWFYGNTITANGDVRSNGRFDAASYSPRIEGEIYAGQEISADNVRGKAGTYKDGEFIYQHPFSPVLEMPNLQDLTYYKTQALERNGTIKIGDEVVVEAVFGDDLQESGNIVLIGTPNNPIQVDGPVVITGDLVISGTVSGQGTIYAGRNIYIAGDIKYKNAPSSPRPSSDNPDVVDKWVEAHKDNDIIGFAASENIVLGDYTKTFHYGYYGYDQWYSNYWLFEMGSEDVGEDGIPYTQDTGEGDGVFQSEYEDLDNDGIFDGNYSWSDVETQTDIENFANLPEGVTDFSDLATNYISKIEGIFYTNHAFCGRVGYGTKINGAIISKDEAIIYRNTLTLNYDERVKSKYTYNPNWLIDLKLPYSERVGVVGWWEE